MSDLRRRAMMAAAAAGGESGILELPWITGHETVTIGANSVTNMTQAATYFASYRPYFVAVLKSAPNTNNQVVSIVINGASALRYRGGSIAQASVASSYDAVLVEGTQYDVYHF